MSEKPDELSIKLGSGNVYIADVTDTPVNIETMCVDANLLGYIKGGCTLDYKPTYFSETDDLGIKTKTVLTAEEATMKMGLVAWNHKTLEHIAATARTVVVGTRKVMKIGGIKNDNKKSYALCFHHIDNEDGDIHVVIRGKNQAGFSLAFTNDKGALLEPEFKCLPMDKDGTLIEFHEADVPAVKGGN